MIKTKYVTHFVIAGVMIRKNDKYLLVQEKREDVYGIWNLPAGRVEVGDAIEDTAVKEAAEETGYAVKLIRKIGVFQESADHPPFHIFEAEIIGGELNFPKDEMLDARWLSIEEISQLAKENKLRRSFIAEVINSLV